MPSEEFENVVVACTPTVQVRLPKVPAGTIEMTAFVSECHRNICAQLAQGNSIYAFFGQFDIGKQSEEAVVRLPGSMEKLCLRETQRRNLFPSEVRALQRFFPELESDLITLRSAKENGTAISGLLPSFVDNLSIGIEFPSSGNPISLSTSFMESVNQALSDKKVDTGPNGSYQLDRLDALLQRERCGIPCSGPITVRTEGTQETYWLYYTVDGFQVFAEQENSFLHSGSKQEQNALGELIRFGLRPQEVMDSLDAASQQLTCGITPTHTTLALYEGWLYHQAAELRSETERSVLSFPRGLYYATNTVREMIFPEALRQQIFTHLEGVFFGDERTKQAASGALKQLFPWDVNNGEDLANFGEFSLRSLDKKLQGVIPLAALEPGVSDRLRNRAGDELAKQIQSIGSKTHNDITGRFNLYLFLSAALEHDIPIEPLEGFLKEIHWEENQQFPELKKMLEAYPSLLEALEQFPASSIPYAPVQLKELKSFRSQMDIIREKRIREEKETGIQWLKRAFQQWFS